MNDCFNCPWLVRSVAALLLLVVVSSGSGAEHPNILLIVSEDNGPELVSTLDLMPTLLEAGAELPESVKRAVMEMVRASRLHQSDSYVAGPTRIE